MQINAICLKDCDNITIPCDLNIYENAGVYKIEITVNQTARLKEAVLFSGEHGFSANTAFYGDGYQKLSQYKGNVSCFDTITGYTDKSHYKMPQTNGFKTVYNYALFGKGENTVLIGAASCNRYRTEIRINDTDLQVVQCLESLEFEKETKICLEDMVILKGERNKILAQFAKIICENHPVKKYCEVPVGWCSWYCIGPNISEKRYF